MYPSRMYSVREFWKGLTPVGRGFSQERVD